MSERFWEEVPLEKLDRAQWEALCDGCGKCCLSKLEDEDTGRIGITGVTCRLLDVESCRCTHYSQRHVRVPDCIEFDATSAAALHWLPQMRARLRGGE